MNADQHIIVKALFKAKVYELSTKAFEDFFISIIREADKDFRPVKPHGQDGDKKNDGFNETTGVYYQIYSPEKPGERIVDAVKKCKKDFEGLKKYWDKISKVKGYYFVFNDKYNGAYPRVEKALKEIKNSNKDLNFCKPFYAQHLEEKLFTLSDNKIFEIICYVPNIDKIEKVDFLAMKNVVEFLLENQKEHQYEENYIVPDFQEKIKFNNLNKQVSNLLVQGSYQNSVITDYFRNQSSFLKPKLKEIFSNLYEEGERELKKNKNKDNLLFFYILNRALPQKEKRIQDAVLVLMSYYFENCDIFEEPK